MNLSASILRELVGSIFTVNPKDVILSGTIEPTWMGYYTSGVSYTKCSEEGIKQVFGFNPEKGFVKIQGCIQHQVLSNGNHDTTYYEAKTLAECVTEDYLFFVTVYYTDHEGCEGFTYTLYKAPNFKAHWDKINAQDIERWSTWLK